VRTLRSISGILLTCAVTLGVVACSSSAPPGIPSAPVGTTGSTGTTTSTGGGNSKESAVATNWTAFFSAKTPVSKRVSLLQDGSEFSAIIQAQAGSTMAQEASAQVTRVSLMSGTLASVSYSILLDGTAALPDQTGQAVLIGTTWEVGVGSFCSLLILENGGSRTSLPPACAAPSPTPTPSS
jgi:hypothetical protein